MAVCGCHYSERWEVEGLDQDLVNYLRSCSGLKDEDVDTCVLRTLTSYRGRKGTLVLDICNRMRTVEGVDSCLEIAVRSNTDPAPLSIVIASLRRKQRRAVGSQWPTCG